MQRIGSKITVTVPDNILADIERLAQTFSMSKAEVSRLLIHTGLDTYSYFQLYGIKELDEVVTTVRKKLENAQNRS